MADFILAYRRICRKGLQYPSIGEYHLDITRLLSGIDPRLHHYCLLLTDVFSPRSSLKAKQTFVLFIFVPYFFFVMMLFVLHFVFLIT